MNSLPRLETIPDQYPHRKWNYDDRHRNIEPHQDVVIYDDRISSEEEGIARIVKHLTVGPKRYNYRGGWYGHSKS